MGYSLLQTAWLRAGIAEEKTSLLKTYWTISERQIETSVVLANPPWRVL
jgi:hypothetical protein